jgi:hypothetical protein
VGNLASAYQHWRQVVARRINATLQFSAALHSSLLFGSLATDIGCPRDVRFSPESDQIATSH